MKLYEIWLRKLGFGSPAPEVVTAKALGEEEKIYNPLKVKIGGLVKIDTLEYRDHRFFVKDITEYKVAKGTKIHNMADYTLVSRPINGEDLVVKLRAVPNLDSSSRVAHRALVLSLYDEFAYDDGFKAVVTDPEGKFVCDDDKDDDDPTNDTHEEYWRVNDVKTSYIAKGKQLVDVDGDGQVSPSEVAKTQFEFWDFSRMTEVDTVPVEEFVFVEMSQVQGSFGWTQIWRGAEVIVERIEVF